MKWMKKKREEQTTTLWKFIATKLQSALSSSKSKYSIFMRNYVGNMLNGNNKMSPWIVFLDYFLV